MKRLIISILLLATQQMVWAQRPFSIGLDIMPTQDRFVFDDPGGRLKTISQENPIRWGITGRWYSSERWTTEVGVSFIQVSRPTINYVFPIEIPRVVFLNSPSSVLFVNRPSLQAQYIIRQYYNPVSFQIGPRLSFSIGPYMGLGMTTFRRSENTGWASVFNENYVGFTRQNTEETINSQSAFSYPNSVGWTLESGLSINMFTSPRWHFRYTGTWHAGVNRTTLTRIEYVSSLDPAVNQATITSNGSGRSGAIMVAYRFGRPKAWQR